MGKTSHATFAGIGPVVLVGRAKTEQVQTNAVVCFRQQLLEPQREIVDGFIRKLDMLAPLIVFKKT